MGAKLNLLIELQKIDTAIVQANLKKKELPSAIAKLDEQYREEEKQLKGHRSYLDELFKKHRSLEEELKRGMENLRRTKARLFEVKTNKEYQAMLKEIETIEKKNEQLEEDIILLLDEIDEKKKFLKERESRFAQHKEIYERKRAELVREMDSIGDELRTYREQGDALRKQLSSEILRKYDQLRALNNGIAVVSVWKEICGGCHMNIPPQLYNDLMTNKDEIFFCPHCNRIIFWYNHNEKGI
ncbi:MAG: C4-type zinc ribbon domain-containing protein [Syntrophales bacterium]|nr:C4-type zinc ribbon domain-containing protein [Syntrophales bacterium]